MFLDFEVVLSGTKWIQVGISGPSSILLAHLGCCLKGQSGAATSREHTGHGG